MEKLSAEKLIELVDDNIRSIHSFISGTTLLSENIQKLITSLVHQETPVSWLDKWEGPEDPMEYLQAIVAHSRAIEKWFRACESRDFLDSTMNLAELFRPDVFLNSLRQHFARESHIPMDTLKLVCTWNGALKGTKNYVKINGLQLEGCLFDSVKLSECQENSASVSTLPDCHLNWIEKDAQVPFDESRVIQLPVYFNSNRDRIIAKLDIPIDGDRNKWLQMGAAIILQQI